MSNNFLVVLLLLVPLADLVQCADKCASDWKEYNGHCYKAVVAKLDEPDAEAECNKDDAHLASIHSRDENEFIGSLLDAIDSGKTGWFYIGLKLKRVNPNEKVLSAYWTDGSGMGFGDPKVIGNGTYPWGTYKTDKGSGPEPNNYGGGETCVMFGHDDNSKEPLPIKVGWLDTRCVGNHYKNGYVCRK